MEREIISEKIDDGKEIETGYAFGDKPLCINTLIKYLTDSKDNGATHVEIWSEGNYDGADYVDIYPVRVETESDEAYAERLQEKESKRLAAENIAKAIEKALYEELKEKYEKE